MAQHGGLRLTARAAGVQQHRDVLRTPIDHSDGNGSTPDDRREEAEDRDPCQTGDTRKSMLSPAIA